VCAMNNEIPLSKAELEIAATCSDKPAPDYSETSSFSNSHDSVNIIMDIQVKLSTVFYRSGISPKSIYLSRDYFETCSGSAFFYRGENGQYYFNSDKFPGIFVYLVDAEEHIGVGL